MFRWSSIPMFALAVSVAAGAQASEDEVARGRHLVDLMACAVCHSPRDPKTNVPIPGDYSGGRVGRHEADLGVFFAPNLTGDKETGLGAWSDDEIADALLKGVRPDGRQLTAAMPWKGYQRYMRKDEVRAVIAFLRTLKPVRHKVPDPVGVGQKSPSPYYRIVPAGTVAP